jgi:hypothetical protein
MQYKKRTTYTSTSAFICASRLTSSVGCHKGMSKCLKCLTVWYAWVLLLFSASAATDTGSKSFECALVSTLETYDDPQAKNGNCINYITYICLVYYAY